MRRKQSEGSSSTVDMTGDLLANDINAAGAEMAYAKCVNVYWDGSVNTWKQPDCNGRQIRHTGRVDGKLIVRQRDSDNETYVLVRGQMPLFFVVGSIKGVDAKQDKYRHPGNPQFEPAWFVPEGALA